MFTIQNGIPAGAYLEYITAITREVNDNLAGCLRALGNLPGLRRFGISEDDFIIRIENVYNINGFSPYRLANV
jgi:hypothetical protein